ncbi:unnamed protein product [Meloidogyne enterolobii]|uniref:Uncharacterized protein n=1 Tax=Meloidogyne enterolobii TaxID=390850 RepID=A0ACB0ZWY4_MELEN
MKVFIFFLLCFSKKSFEQNLTQLLTTTFNSNITTTKTTLKTTTPAQTTTKTSFSSSSQTIPLQLKVGLLAANGSLYRSLYGFGQSTPAISIALQRARDEHLIDNVNFTYVNFRN